MEQLFQRLSRMKDMIPSFMFPATFVLALIVERLFSARQQPKIRGWLFVGIAFFALAGVINTVLAPALARGFLGDHRIADLTALGTIGGAIVAMLATDLVAYLLHRGAHVFHPVWRMHQLHHSPERVDIAGFSYSHPIDLGLAAVLTTIVSVAIGVSVDAAVLAAYTLFTLGIVGHLNLRTPVWLGYIIQRPEAHSLHHARNVHAYNYSTLPIVDIVFGTFRNPHEFAEHAGFGNRASRRVGAMLLGRDVVSSE